MQEPENQNTNKNEAMLRVGVASELARQYGADASDFFQSLAILLEAMLPGVAQIEKRGGLFSKKKAFRISVPNGENRLVLEEAAPGVLQATHTRIKRGIALKTEEVAVEEWLGELSAALETRAQSSEAARRALSQFVDF